MVGGICTYRHIAAVAEMSVASLFSENPAKSVGVLTAGFCFGSAEPPCTDQYVVGGVGGGKREVIPYPDIWNCGKKILLPGHSFFSIIYKLYTITSMIQSVVPPIR
jgi:hypothetical protein